jgi:hypothetical protein
VKRHPRIDAVLHDPAHRAAYEEFKRLVGLAADRYGANDLDGHMVAAMSAYEVGQGLVEAVRAVPRNAGLPPREVYRYVANAAHDDMLGPMAKADDVKLFELGVKLPPGRPPTARPRARQLLIDEMKRRPDKPDWRIADLARELGVWTHDQADDARSKRRRIRRLRSDAAN